MKSCDPHGFVDCSRHQSGRDDLARWGHEGRSKGMDGIAYGATEFETTEGELAMIAVSILRRRLREGQSYEDFRKAWFHEEGFNAPNRMLTMLNVADRVRSSSLE